MKTNYLIYYVLKLITKGQEWQYKNLNGKGDRPKLYFTQLQLIARFFVKFGGNLFFISPVFF
ncbi:hypothetical protein, partial [Bacteroides sp. AF27-33]|uniref:hypothetical protein n=1 Tax=Bacteroides sp. AF27-33 TaxID=2292194 RepID=UPI001F418ECD